MALTDCQPLRAPSHCSIIALKQTGYNSKCTELPAVAPTELSFEMKIKAAASGPSGAQNIHEYETYVNY